MQNTQNHRNGAIIATLEAKALGNTPKKTKDLRPGEPAKPVGLSEKASAYWDRLVPELRDSGIVLTPGHRA